MRPHRHELDAVGVQLRVQRVPGARTRHDERKGRTGAEADGGWKVPMEDAGSEQQAITHAQTVSQLALNSPPHQQNRRSQGSHTIHSSLSLPARALPTSSPILASPTFCCLFPAELARRRIPAQRVIQARRDCAKLSVHPARLDVPRPYLNVCIAVVAGAAGHAILHSRSFARFTYVRKGSQSGRHPHVHRRRGSVREWQ
jgi:hypothetical protein